MSAAGKEAILKYRAAGGKAAAAITQANFATEGKAYVAALRELAKVAEKRRTTLENELNREMQAGTQAQVELQQEMELAGKARGLAATPEEQARRANNQHCTINCKSSEPPASPGAGSFGNPAFSCEALRDAGNTASGAFYIQSYDLAKSDGPTKVFCDLDRGHHGGGWTLLMKAAADGGDTFKFSADYWTAPNTLNADDVSAHSTMDAKYDSFNKLQAREFMAWFPQDNFGLTIGPFAASTALEFFQTSRVLDRRPTNRPDFRRDVFSSQARKQQYSIAHKTSRTAVRWGYSFNDDDHWKEPDAVGGIGIDGSAEMAHATASAGDFVNPHVDPRSYQHANARPPRTPYSMAVLIYGRSGSGSAEAEAAARRAEDEAAAAAEAAERAELAAAAKSQSSADCTAHFTCDDCRAVGCAWCIAGRKCVLDKPWICQGDEDHISPPGGTIGQVKECPSIEKHYEVVDLRRAREEKAVRDREEATAARERKFARAAEERKAAAAEADAAQAAGGDGGDTADGSAPKRETGAAADGKEGGDGAAAAEAKAKASKDKEKVLLQEHHTEIKRRAEDAGEESGAMRPYEVLDLPKTASPSEIRRAYRRLSLKFHPDKNLDILELAKVAFADLVAANEVLSNPDVRAAFDEKLGSDSSHGAKTGAGGTTNFYLGDPYITSLTENLWEKRLFGKSIWLVEFYAPWCGGCKIFMPQFKKTALAMKDERIDVGAVNCETQKTLCTWFQLKKYPTVFLVNREFGMRQVRASTRALCAVRCALCAVRCALCAVRFACGVRVLTMDRRPSTRAGRSTTTACRRRTRRPRASCSGPSPSRRSGAG
jgi:thiol-disulfide isomerase/thioredoxin